MRLANRNLSLRIATALISFLAVGTVLRAGGKGSPGACQIDSGEGNIQHVIFIIFDNTHFRRDNPNVPSDLEQMPNLLKFIRNKGTLFTNDHTILISHTAGGILTNLTGVYPDRHGQAVTNSYRYFKADGSTASSSSFKYWTDLVDDTGAVAADPLPNMVTADSGSPKMMPAPWVPYTRAGCDFGAAGLANIVLENTGTGPAGDMTKVFGSGSVEWTEAQTSNAAAFGTAARALAQTDFVGIAVHCGNGGGICTGNANARPDSLPDEPQGYNGFQGLFGAKYVIPAINSGGSVLNDLDENMIVDPFGQSGFPGFDGVFPNVTLSYIASMQEAGIPITFGYISDAHDEHGSAGQIHTTDGPGQAQYVDQLKRYDEAFGKFFTRLAAHGIAKDNTLFVFTVEEGDHFVGSQPLPAGCDGVKTPCTYNLVGEINGNLAGLLATDKGITTPFTVHSDMAPTIYITGNPTRTAPVTRDFGRALSTLTAVSPYTSQLDNLAVALADPIGMKALHMVTADPQRTPTLTMFAHPDYFFFAGAPNCNSPCVTVPTTPPTSTFAWNHGGIQEEIAQTWLGVVGPGVRKLGQDNETWLDHTDVRPTMLSLLGLQDTYVHDGRVLIETIDKHAQPSQLSGQSSTLKNLISVYKQINAPFGQLGMDTLKVSTAAVASNTTSDAAYNALENKIAAWTGQRDALATEMKGMLDDASFNNKDLNESRAKQLIKAAQDLLGQVSACAANFDNCAL